MQDGLEPIPAGSIQIHTVEPFCPICTEDFTNPVKTPCNHIFDDACIRIWLQTSEKCPMCKRELFQRPSPTPPDYSADVEPLRLDFDLDQGALVRELNVFVGFHEALPRDTHPDFTIAQDRKVYIDFATLSPKMVAAAMWMKPDIRHRTRSGNSVCRTYWEWAVNEMKDLLEYRDGFTLDAAGFRSKLEAEVKRYIIWKIDDAVEMPTYHIDFTTGRTLTSDLGVVRDYITWCAVQEYERRFQPELVELEKSG